MRGEEKEVDINRIKDIFKLLRKDNIERISFIGGEPFLKDYFIDIVLYTKGLGFKTSVVTNGTLLSKNMIEKIVNSEAFDDMIFSIDGYDALCDYIRGKGTYDRVSKNILLIGMLKKEMKKKKPRILIYLTVSKYNWKEMKKSVDDIIKLNPSKIRLQLASYVSEKLIEKANRLFMKEVIKAHSYSCDVSLSYDEVRYVRECLKELKKIHGGRIVTEKVLDGGNGECRFIFKDCVITPSGRILPCPMMNNFDIGNIYEISLKEAYERNYESLLMLVELSKNGFDICRQCCVEKVWI